MPGASRSDACLPDACPSDACPSDTRPPINADWLARMRTEKPDFLARLFEVFLAEEPARIARLCAAIEAGDLKMVCYLAHALKGAAATLGMERLRDACRTLELAAKAGETPHCAECFARIEAEIAEVYAVMRSL